MCVRQQHGGMCAGRAPRRPHRLLTESALGGSGEGTAGTGGRRPWNQSARWEEMSKFVLAVEGAEEHRRHVACRGCRDGEAVAHKKVGLHRLWAAPEV